MKQSSHLLFIWSILLATICLFACNGKETTMKQEENKTRVRYIGEAKDNPKVEELDKEPNATLKAVLMELEDDSVVLRRYDTGEIIALDIQKALHEGSIKGKLTEGNDFYITANLQQQQLESAINTSELEGQWFYDLEERRGLTFLNKGAISSINSGDIDFRQWKIINGKLYLYYLTSSMIALERSEYLVEPADIEELSSEKLRFVFLGKTYECQRLKGKLKLQ